MNLIFDFCISVCNHMKGFLCETPPFPDRTFLSQDCGPFIFWKWAFSSMITSFHTRFQVHKNTLFSTHFLKQRCLSRNIRCKQSWKYLVEYLLRKRIFWGAKITFGNISLINFQNLFFWQKSIIWQKHPVKWKHLSKFLLFLFADSNWETRL